MPNYPKKDSKGRVIPGKRRIVVTIHGKSHERVIQATKSEGDRFEATWRLELGKEAESQTPPKLRDATYSDLLKAYASYCKMHLKNRLEDICSNTLNDELKVIRSMRTWGIEQGYPIPTFKIRDLPVRGGGRPKFWTLEQLGGIYKAAKEVYEPMVGLLTFLLNTGCCKGEAIACDWDWIDLKAGVVRIPANEVWEPKDGEPREIPISDELRKVLKGPRAHPVVVFPSRYGRRFKDFPYDTFNLILETAGEPGTPHWTRHTFASHFLAKCPDMFLLAKILGHSTTYVTEIYAHLMPGQLARAVNAVNLGPDSMARRMAS